jgi:large subunit ribosomal protein L6
MKSNILELVQIPQGTICSIENNIVVCKKGSASVKRRISEPGIDVKIENEKISVSCKKGNKSKYKIVKSIIAHLNNLIEGLDKAYEYKLEMCNVHFPMTAKVEKGHVIISNFLGEKKNRKAKIIEGVKVEISGHEITVSSNNKEDAGQTAANLEEATKISKRDRRVFQDGIFIKQKLGRAI